MKASYILAGICFALFFLFVYASVSKLIAFDYYLYDLKRSPLLHPYASTLAIAVPLLELMVAALLLPDRTRRHGLAGAVLLMLLFTGYVVYVVSFTGERPCTCGGIIRQLSWPQHLVFNSFFLLIALVGYYLERSKKNIPQNNFFIL